MKVISLLLAFINSLMGGILILSCVSAGETLAWITMKTGTGLMAIYFGALAFKDSIVPVRLDRFLINNLLLVIVGMAIAATGVHWSLISGDIKNTVLLVGGSLFTQGITTMLAIAGEISSA